MLAVAVFDRVDDGFADRHADPMHAVFVEGGHLPHSITEDLDNVQHVDGYLAGADCIATLSCLEAYGVPVSRSVSARGLLVRIDGRGLRGFRPPSAPLDCANSGTSMRLLAGLAAAHPFRSVLGGDES